MRWWIRGLVMIMFKMPDTWLVHGCVYFGPCVIFKMFCVF